MKTDITSIVCSCAVSSVSLLSSPMPSARASSVANESSSSSYAADRFVSGLLSLVSSSSGFGEEGISLGEIGAEPESGVTDLATGEMGLWSAEIASSAFATESSPDKTGSSWEQVSFPGETVGDAAFSVTELPGGFTSLSPSFSSFFGLVSYSAQKMEIKRIKRIKRKNKCAIFQGNSLKQTKWWRVFPKISGP